MSMRAKQKLWPAPRRFDSRPADLVLDAQPASMVVGGERAALGAIARLSLAWSRAGVAPSSDASRALDCSRGRSRAHPRVRLAIDPGLGLPAQGYRLQVDGAGAELVGKDAAGLYYAACTLSQWIELHIPPERGPLTLPGMVVEDWPDLARRGVLLDISRDRVPTTGSLFALVDLLASWKVNQLQLYMEHTFAYRGHEVVWHGANPLTPDEARALDAHCRARFIELVPCQNSFGHFHRWLVHDAYRRLAECPEGIAHPFSDQIEPFSLCPVDPGALLLLEELYDQLLPCFTSRQLNVGLDETLDLGRGRSAAACAERGREEVYLEFLHEVHARVAARGRRMQFWADVLIERPELLAGLPSDVVTLLWGYEANHPFDAQARLLAEAGVTFYVCPGTSSWNSLAGRSDNAVANLAAAARAGRDHGAAGYLITDWGDHGHLQPPPVSVPGLLAGAGFAWNVATTDAEPLTAFDLPALLDAHAFADRGRVTGGVVCELGNAYRALGAPAFNGTALFYLLRFPQHVLSHKRFAGLSQAALEAAVVTIAAARARLGHAQVGGDDAELLKGELRWVADMLTLACRLGQARLDAGWDTPLDVVDPTTRQSLADSLATLIAEHRQLWLARSRPGGLDHAHRWLRKLHALLKDPDRDAPRAP